MTECDGCGAETAERTRHQDSDVCPRCFEILMNNEAILSGMEAMIADLQRKTQEPPSDLASLAAAASGLEPQRVARPGHIVCDHHSTAHYLDGDRTVVACSVCGTRLQTITPDPPGSRWLCGWATDAALRLVVDGRVLTGEDLGGPGEVYHGEVGGRLVGRWSGAGAASLALLWLATGDGAS